MDRLIIGVWQGACNDGDLAANLARAERAIDEAAAAGCDFLCMPELFLSGGDKAESKQQARKGGSKRSSG